MFLAQDKLYKNYLKMKFLNLLMNIMQNIVVLLKDLNMLKNLKQRKKKREELKEKEKRKIKDKRKKKERNSKYELIYNSQKQTF